MPATLHSLTFECLPPASQPASQSASQRVHSFSLLAAVVLASARRLALFHSAHTTSNWARASFSSSVIAVCSLSLASDLARCSAYLSCSVLSWSVHWLMHWLLWLEHSTVLRSNSFTAVYHCCCCCLTSCGSTFERCCLSSAGCVCVHPAALTPGALMLICFDSVLSLLLLCWNSVSFALSVLLQNLIKITITVNWSSFPWWLLFPCTMGVVVLERMCSFYNVIWKCIYEYKRKRIHLLSKNKVSKCKWHSLLQNCTSTSFHLL